MTPVYMGVALAWGMVMIGLPLSGLSLDASLTAAFLLVCGLLVWAAGCLRLRGLARIAMAIEAWGLLAMASMAGILGTYIVARYPAPLADQWMVSVDRLIAPGLDWRQMMFGLTRHPWLLSCANHAYGTLQWQGSLLILLCCAAGQTERCAAFVLRWTIALALVVAVFAFLPCDGPNAYHHLTHAEVPGIGSNAGWCAPKITAWLRTRGPLQLDLSALDGIVTFPSFHAAGATLFAWGFWGVRRARWPMLALNLAMIAATPPIGGHYLADTLAGVAIASISIALPGLCVRLRTKLTQPSLLG